MGRVLLAGLASACSLSSVRAAIVYWDAVPTNAVWGSNVNWSTSSTQDTPNPSATPGASDVARFNRAGTQTTISLVTATTSGGITFDTAAASAYIIGAGTVDSQNYALSNASTIQMTSSVINDQTFNARVRLGTNTAAANYWITNAKTGTGTWTLSASNTYTGATAVSVGTLAITGSLGNTAVGVSGSGTLALQNAGAVSQNTITVSGLGSLTEAQPNAITGAAALVVNGTGALAVLDQHLHRSDHQLRRRRRHLHRDHDHRPGHAHRGH